jgi:hypothetical protein
METENSKKYVRLYNKYKSKYLQLKNKELSQTGGSYNLAQLEINKITIYINEIEQLLKKVRDVVPKYKIQLLGSKNINFDPEDLAKIKKQINKVIESLKNYIESNDIPIEINGYPYIDLGELEEFINKIKINLDIKKLKAKYSLRETIYSIDDKNYEEILDIIITDFNITNIIDIEKIFQSSILGHNKNYIIGYMVLFRFLIKNNIQLTTINNNITYLTFSSIFISLNNSINIEEYIPILINLINHYIKTNPIKKIIKINIAPEIEKTNDFKESQLFGEISNKIDFIDSYDSKNKVIFYKSGIMKEDKKATFDDLKHIINTLVRIQVFPFIK